MVQVSGRTKAKPGFVDTEFLLTFHYEILKTRTEVFWYKELPHTHHPALSITNILLIKRLFGRITLHSHMNFQGRSETTLDIVRRS